MPALNMPQAGVGYVRKVRDVKNAEAVYDLMMKQYEAARIDEAREAALIQVVDRALPPEKAEKPRPVFLLVCAAFIGLLAALGAAAAMEWRERLLLDPYSRARLAVLKGAAAGGREQRA